MVASFQKEINHLIDWQKGIVKEIGKPKSAVHLAEPDESLIKVVKEFLAGKLEAAMFSKNKQEREAKMSELHELLRGHVLEQGLTDKEVSAAEHLFENATDELVHRKILEENQRPDGRKLDEIRDLHAEVGVLKRTHGSAVFVRGNTQALVVTTIAPPGSEQLIETMEFSGKRRFILHYNFPPYSTGEVGRDGNPGRREI